MTRLILVTPQGRVALPAPWVRAHPALTLGDAATRWLDEQRDEQERLLAQIPSVEHATDA
jgi:hypothetical protein